MNKQNRNGLIDSENRLMVQRGGSLGGWVKEVKGLSRTDLLLQNSHRDVKYSIGNIVHNTSITVYLSRSILEISGRHFVKYTVV